LSNYGEERINEVVKEFEDEKNTLAGKYKIVPILGHECSSIVKKATDVDVK